MIEYLVSLLSFFIVFYYLYKTKSLVIVLYMVSGALYYFPALFDTLSSDRKYLDTVYSLANFYSLLVNLAILISIMCADFLCSNFGGTVRRARDVKMEKKILHDVMCFVFISSFIVLVLSVLNITGGGGLLSYSWADKFSSTGGGKGFLLATYLFITSSSCCYILFRSERWWLFFIMLTIALFFIILIRSRGFIVPVVMPFIIHYLFKSGVKNKVNFSIIAFVFIASFFILQQIRYLGDLTSFSNFNLLDIISKSIEKIIYGDSEFSLRNSFYYFIDNYEEHRGELGGLDTFRRIFFFFDVFGFGLKPDDFSYALYRIYYGYNSLISGASLHPTFYGMLYANGTYFSIPFICFLVFMLRAFEIKVSERIYWLVVPCVSYGLVFIGRGSFYNGFIFSLLPILIIITLYFLFKRFD